MVVVDIHTLVVVVVGMRRKLDVGMVVVGMFVVVPRREERVQPLELQVVISVVDMVEVSEKSVKQCL